MSAPVVPSYQPSIPRHFNLQQALGRYRNVLQQNIDPAPVRSKCFHCDFFTAPHPPCELQRANLKITYLSNNPAVDIIERFFCFNASLDYPESALPPGSLIGPSLIEVVEYGTARSNAFFLETGTQGRYRRDSLLFGVGERVGTLSITASVLLWCVEHGKQWEVNALG